LNVFLFGQVEHARKARDDTINKSEGHSKLFGDGMTWKVRTFCQDDGLVTTVLSF